MRDWESVDCESERLRVTDLFADVQLDLDKKWH